MKHAERAVIVSLYAPLPNAAYTLAEHYVAESKQAGFIALYHDAKGNPYLASLTCRALSLVDSVRFDSAFWLDYCVSFHMARYGVSGQPAQAILTLPHSVYCALERLRRDLQVTLPSDEHLQECGYLASGEQWRVKGAVSASFAVCGAFQFAMEREDVAV